MKKFFIYFFPVILLVFFVKCSTEPEKQYTNFTVKVDSIHLAKTVSINDTIEITFYGLIGYDGCHSFSHFETTEKPLKLDLTVLGKKPEFSTVCPQVLIYLDGKKYKTKAISRGIYRVYIHQPDGSFLIDSIKII